MNTSKTLEEWASNQLLDKGYSLISDQASTVVETPWSCVLRFETNNGSIYLKQTPKALALEASII